jgi:hypothetical protein
MAFLTIDGLPIPTAKDSFKETTRDIGDEPMDGALGIVMSTRVGKLRRWTFRTPRLAPEEWLAFQTFLEGYGASWRFASGSKISDQGYTNTVVGSYTTSGVGGVFGGSVAVGSTSHFSAMMRYRMGRQTAAGWAPANGWTLMVWRTFVAAEAYAGTRHCLITGTADFVRGSAANPAGVKQYIDGVLDAAAGLGNCLSVSATSPYVGIHGYKTTGAANAITYSDLVFLPFRLPNLSTAIGSQGLTEAQWALALYASHLSAQWSLSLIHI